MDNWDDLKFVLAIATAGNVTRAAKRLGVTHSTVSRRLSALEESMATRLFERLPEGFVPTAAGEQAVAAARRVEAEVLTLDTRITAQDTELEGPLRITAAQLLFQVQLAEIMQQFSERHPRIELQMIAANEKLSLHRREADIAVRVTDNPGETLFGRLATGQNRCYYMSRNFARKYRETMETGHASIPLPCVTFKWWGQGVPKEIRTRYTSAFISLVADDMIALLAAVKAGIGVGRLPCFLGDPDPDLVRIPGMEPSRYLDIWVLTHPDLKNVARIRTFLRFAADAFKARSGLYLGT
ncbi:DNA-binding transcriptional LysR family regulator [Labrenzia sp. EL_208]|uniref:LysR family transcriptional regulator n=1 Tax=Roseibium album TaxID=311410 RepID=UPI000D560CF8|nr:LysR family transcriptional regulator [Roseibium album]MBG6160661.1 DNA-binding transcriptional LysR family regulator [Labrenzia sp. EL_195]MBG6175420.1 DNA-binding transcriptional LysR family regulator [Labrenzia sp. EL_132]MBG6197362.1 DNA-binding transcriptional LysR family regulator [Labrenzia sp. EL_159]MBG6203700.1 DNA-binding transcriptional LysR family regulator [Labrenzia sp. EL_13]MBG6206494.1 DNA-binding transcriptional LysR family regulator [Labrenzia sp. EL_126]MBG6230036.1 DN